MNTLAAAGHLDDTRISEINEGVDRAFASLKSFDGLSRNARSVEKLGKQLTKDIGLLKAEIVDSLEAIQSSMSLDLDAVELEGRQVLEIEALTEENFIDDEELGINLNRPDKVA